MKSEFENNERQVINTSQDVYDAFNNLVFSSDVKVLGKFVARAELFSQVKDVPGDVVECGVFKGSGMLCWLKLKALLAPNSFKKIIGFDYFDTDSLINSLTGDDLIKMQRLFDTRKFQHEKGFKEILHQKINRIGFNNSEFELIEGDVRVEAPNFVEKRPGFKISLLYMDLDLASPTYSALSAFWDRISEGGIVVFDEYAYHQWSESKGADEFFKDKGVQIKSLDYQAPTAYVLKK